MNLTTKLKTFKQQILVEQQKLLLLQTEYEFWHSLSCAIKDAGGAPNAFDFEDLESRPLKDLKDTLINNGIQFVWVDQKK